uniref:Uncharacterized protein n=1 Tax=Rhizophora mucronata TaxID=61149 RepID=A0A2P2L5M4_RHIMU
MKAIPSARYEIKQGKQDQCHHFQLPLSKQYLPPQCLTKEEPECKKSIDMCEL